MRFWDSLLRGGGDQYFKVVISLATFQEIGKSKFNSISFSFVGAPSHYTRTVSTQHIKIIILKNINALLVGFFLIEKTFQLAKLEPFEVARSIFGLKSGLKSQSLGIAKGFLKAEISFLTRYKKYVFTRTKPISFFSWHANGLKPDIVDLHDLL